MKIVFVETPDSTIGIQVSDVIFNCVESFVNEYNPDPLNDKHSVFVIGKELENGNFMLGNGKDAMEVDLLELDVKAAPLEANIETIRERGYNHIELDEDLAEFESYAWTRE